jgi:two-component system, sensor histidine kinase PdtaS
MSDHQSIETEIATSLALAMITSSNVPLVLLDHDLAVVAASVSFSRAFDIDPGDISGRKLVDLGQGEWNGLQLGALLRATAAGNSEIGPYEMNLEREGLPPRRLLLNARKLDYAGPDVRILLTIADVTDARLAEKLKDDLLREKAILLQELQHRVANSLQIVASVLMLSARRVQSEETRAHLRDAHQRVMSIAAVQRQLAISSLSDVGLRTYFTDLCESLGASMIHDHQQLSLEVSADDSLASADVSVSLGLIVTELVINALKHAFPNHRKGKILVDYKSSESGWMLSVHDDGVGMNRGIPISKPGLGTSIVEALARQLGAEVHTMVAHPGTTVSINHV